MPTYCQDEWWNNLSPEQQALIDRYYSSCSNLKALILRRPQDTFEDPDAPLWSREELPIIDRAIEELRHRGPMTLWCAVPEGNKVRECIVDGLYRYQPYISVTRSEDAVGRFFAGIIADPVLLKFDMERDFCAAVPGTHNEEGELILPRAMTYRVMDCEIEMLAKFAPHMRDAAKTAVTIIRVVPEATDQSSGSR
jgi:hypothetical protein